MATWLKTTVSPSTRVVELGEGADRQQTLVAVDGGEGRFVSAGALRTGIESDG